MNDQNYENELVEFYSNKIIESIGSKYSLESIDDYNADPSYHGKFEGYGFEISIVYDDKKFDDYEYLDIKFNGKKVYTHKDGILIYGVWQEALAELYKKIPIILRKDEINKKRCLHALDLYKKYINPIIGRVGKINNNITLGSYTEYDPYGGYGNTTTYHNVVKKNGKVVLDVIDRIYSFSIYSYTPGNWEDEIIDFYNRYNNRETEEERASAIRTLKYIRDI